MSADNLINELYDYWKNNVIEKNDIPKQYIMVNVIKLSLYVLFMESLNK